MPSSTSCRCSVPPQSEATTNCSTSAMQTRGAAALGRGAVQGRPARSASTTAPRTASPTPTILLHRHQAATPVSFLCNLAAVHNLFEEMRQGKLAHGCCCVGHIFLTVELQLPEASLVKLEPRAAAVDTDAENRKLEDDVAVEAEPQAAALARLDHNLLDRMSEPQQQALGIPGVKELSRKIKYDYRDYLHTVCGCAGSDLQRESEYEESMKEGLRCFAQGCLW